MNSKIIFLKGEGPTKGVVRGSGGAPSEPCPRRVQRGRAGARRPFQAATSHWAVDICRPASVGVQLRRSRRLGTMQDLSETFERQSGKRRLTRHRTRHQRRSRLLPMKRWPRWHRRGGRASERRRSGWLSSQRGQPQRPSRRETLSTSAAKRAAAQQAKEHAAAAKKAKAQLTYWPIVLAWDASFKATAESARSSLVFLNTLPCVGPCPLRAKYDPMGKPNTNRGEQSTCMFGCCGAAGAAHMCGGNLGHRCPCLMCE